MNVHSHVDQDEFRSQLGAGDFGRSRTGISALTVGALGIGLEAFAVIALSVATGLAYHLTVYANAGNLVDYLSVGTFLAVVLTLPFISRGDYRLSSLISGTRRPRDITLAWNYAFICLVVLGFLTKTTTMYSRGWLVLFYLSGVVALPLVTAFTSHAVRQAIQSGRIERRRLMLIGEEDAMRAFLRRIAGNRSGVAVTSTIDIGRCLTGDLDLRDALDDAVRIARKQGVEDVVILTDWAKADIIDRIADRFAELPVAVQLAAPAEMARFRRSRLTHYGRAPAFALSSPPLLPYQLLFKRGFDALVSAIALVLLAPVFAFIAAAIKLDSPGPVFFRQHRRGYNHREFLIWKFRTMTVMDNGDTIVQAQRNDSRITRIGRYLRKLNLDELPQLINVITGDMSLVGPRPHAVAHDRHFEPRIRRYARRLNVKPGITGWAQVNGHRGLTETENDMKNRVVHDLYYIENWSIAFDVYILMRTVLSPRAYRNAF